MCQRRLQRLLYQTHLHGNLLQSPKCSLGFVQVVCLFLYGRLHRAVQGGYFEFFHIGISLSLLGSLSLI